MCTDTFGPKLTAILSADVKGNSRLMGEDEAATVLNLTPYWEVMTTLIHSKRTTRHVVRCEGYPRVEEGVCRSVCGIRKLV